VTQLDSMTQQNAALVEESAAAAESLKDQSRQLSGALSGFRFAAGDAPAGPKAVASKVVSQAASAARSKPAAAAPKAEAAAPTRPAPAAKKAAAPATKPQAAGPAAKAAAPAAASGAGDEDWETF